MVFISLIENTSFVNGSLKIESVFESETAVKEALKWKFSLFSLRA